MIRRLLSPLLLCLMIAAPAFAQQPTTVPVFPLKPGTIEGNINDAAPLVRYSFDASADDSVSISMETTSGDLDPFLFLYAPNGALVERNDDRESGNRNALIALTLPQRGTYVIEATRFDQASALTSGTFRLTLALSGAQATGTPTDPLSAPPNFTVPFTIIDYQSVVAGSISADAPQRYYAIGGQQGDLIRVIMTRTSGDLSPSLRVRGDRSEEISRETQARAGESIAYVTLPQTGWYLIEAGRESDGTGSFDLYATRLAAEVLQVGQPETATFTPETPSLSYIVNARIGDSLTVTMFTTDGASGVQPQLELLDLSLSTIERATGERFVTLRAPIPRSGPYIIRASNLTADTSGGFSLRLTSAPGTPITAQTISYNNQYKGAVTADQPLKFYRFLGKTGELVTIAMNASEPAGGDLNAYLILMDSDLNELAANDDVSTTRDARITQYRLPKDGEYIVLATRAGLLNGTTTGNYDLALTAGEISLTAGALTATLRWAGGADLNLFVRDPGGRTVSWSSPQVPSGGILQIDSNTRCETPSDQPVEHVYWSALVGGDYEVWAWYEDGCGVNVSTEFTLDVSVDGSPMLHTADRLRAGQRYQVGLRVTDAGQGFVIDPGAIINPSPQQRASEGGDTVIRYGESLTGTISGEVYALFYQFAGSAGDVVTITAERLSGNLDPVIVLRDAADHALPDGVNDDADAATQDARLTYTLPADGTYIIAVTRYGVRDGTTTGDFRVSVGKGY